MKIAINRKYGGFKLPQEIADKYGVSIYDDDLSLRTDSALLDWVQSHSFPEETTLRVVEMPNDATDFEISEYDGCEQIIAVIKGKLVHFH